MLIYRPVKLNVEIKSIENGWLLFVSGSDARGDVRRSFGNPDSPSFTRTWREAMNDAQLEIAAFMDNPDEIEKSQYDKLKSENEG